MSDAVIQLDTEEKRESYRRYYADESRYCGGVPSRIVFPETIDEVSACMQDAHARGARCVVSGARTGILGGSVPNDQDILMSFERMKRIRRIDCDGEWYVVAEAGVTLEEMGAYFHAGRYDDVASPESVEQLQDLPPLWFPVNPTEQTASVGGVVSTNASGARSYWYGAVRRWVRRVTVVLADGTVLSLGRGECMAEDGILVLPNGVEIAVDGIAQQYSKNTAGYYLEPEMDAVDLFVGSEGTLGVIVEVEFRLIFEPPANLSQIIYFKNDAELLYFFDAIRNDDDIVPIALEYFDRQALDLLRSTRVAEGASSLLPQIPEPAGAALYIECPFVSEEDLDYLSESFYGLLNDLHIEDDMTWAALDAREHEAMRVFRHAVPEAVNRLVAEHQKDCPSVHKIATDCAVPHEAFPAMLRLYHEQCNAEQLQYVIVGHIGDGHVHVNMLPRTDAECERAQKLYARFAEEAVSRGGTVAAEHGIGRIKKKLLSVQYTPAEIAVMQAVKQALDPKNILSSDVLFST